ncbi:hypothetical protein MRX96_023910 [Rhipicephalus microplus]
MTAPRRRRLEIARSSRADDAMCEEVAQYSGGGNNGPHHQPPRFRPAARSAGDHAEESAAAALCAAASGNTPTSEGLGPLASGGRWGCRAPVPLTCFPSPRHPRNWVMEHAHTCARSPTELSLSLGACRSRNGPGCCQKKNGRSPHRFFDGVRRSQPAIVVYVKRLPFNRDRPRLPAKTRGHL